MSFVILISYTICTPFASHNQQLITANSIQAFRIWCPVRNSSIIKRWAKTVDGEAETAGCGCVSGSGNDVPLQATGKGVDGGVNSAKPQTNNWCQLTANS